ncbi:MAG: glutamate racemase [bacterium]|nr:glutamate racemase [bacterium]
MKIGMFDSGKGGLSILTEARKLLPYENFLYYGDSLNNPYGEKSDEELLKITSSIVDYLIEREVKLIVIACNTATTRCIKKLREMYPNIIFIGTEPAIKVACDHNFKNTLVMATPATIESRRTSELINNNKRDDQNIYLVSCPGLAEAIEKDDKAQVKLILKEVLRKYKDKGIDSIVLGCTHYPFIKKEILEEMPNVVLLDGALGVSKEIKRQLEIHNLLNNSNVLGETLIYNSLDKTTNILK